MAVVQTSGVEAKLATVNVRPWNFVCWQMFEGWTNITGTIFVKNQKCERGGRLKVKIHVLFYGDNSWNVALREIKFGTVKDHGHSISTSFILIFTLFDEVFKYGDDAKIWDYSGTNAEPLCPEFCNFVRCHIFVNYLTWCSIMQAK
jgi:hypothetical protein